MIRAVCARHYGAVSFVLTGVESEKRFLSDILNLKICEDF
jgi:hypothetical protein